MVNGVKYKLDLDKLIKKYRGIIIEKLYESDDYTFDRIIHLSDGLRDVLMIVYVRERKREMR